MLVSFVYQHRLGLWLRRRVRGSRVWGSRLGSPCICLALICRHGSVAIYAREQGHGRSHVGEAFGELGCVLPRSALYVGASRPLGVITEFIAQRLPQALRQQVCSLSCSLQALAAGRTEGCRGHLRLTRNWVCGRAVAHTC